jgi:Spy/CpxP family protein refolding chaperone
MKRLIFGFIWVSLMASAPVYAQGSGENPLSELAQQLNLSEMQKKEMRVVVDQFLEKQAQVPLPGDVVLENRAMLKEIITNAKFDESKARAFVQKVTAVIEDATVNRLQLRHDLYAKLTPEQQTQYLIMVQKAVAEALN